MYKLLYDFHKFWAQPPPPRVELHPTSPEKIPGNPRNLLPLLKPKVHPLPPVVSVAIRQVTRARGVASPSANLPYSWRIAGGNHREFRFDRENGPPRCLRILRRKNPLARALYQRSAAEPFPARRTKGCAGAAHHGRSFCRDGHSQTGKFAGDHAGSTK